jgi:hypothetical protein
MMKKSWLLFLLLPALLMTGCSDSNSDATLGAHPADWFVAHRATADISECGICHGADLRGSGAAPSCFSNNFNGQSCHPDGPGQAPHPTDGTYLQGSNHGPDAKADLTFCQRCHSSDPTGGPGSNPRFNVGIAAAGGTGCEGCHGTNYAHPQNWAGPNDTFHYSAGNIQGACTLCHGTALDGVGGVGVSCAGCHAETTDFTLDCSFCHGFPPDGTTADLDVPNPVAHRGVADISQHDVCVVCHGMKESDSGGTFSAAPNYDLFNAATDTPGDHWNGSINMNSATQYNQVNFGCDAAGCHGNDAAHQLSDSGLPVRTADYGLGAGVPHPVDGSFLSPANHGPAAKGQTANFPNGIADCQGCHANPASGSNPRFNVGIVSVGGTGCEACHNDFTAHPSSAAPDAAPWYDLGPTHSDISPAKYDVMCTLCHGANLDGVGGVPGAGGCNDCHNADPVANPACVSCHSLPPNGAAGVAGDVRPNREGRHLSPGAHQVACGTCHNGAGFGTANHFDQAAPADVVIQDSFGDPAGAGSYDPATGSCSNITCHGGAGTTFGPWYP